MNNEIDIKQAEDIARCKASLEALDAKIDYRFDRLEGWFEQVEKNTSFRKSSYSVAKVLAILGPVIVGAFIML